MVHINNIAINCKLLFAITLASVLLIILNQQFMAKGQGEAPPLRERLFFAEALICSLVL